MSTPSAKLLVFVGDRFACVKIVGRANFTSSIDFRTLVSELRAKQYDYFVLDLSECVLMDSTFLGVLTGLGLQMNSGDKAPEDRAIELLNPNPRISELLENLGVLHLFKVTQGPLVMPDCKQSEHTCLNASKEEVTSACLEAHQTLMAVNPDNVSRFKEVTQFLASDLKKLRSKADA
jgi:anti-sigma B factor antagonist